MKFIPFDFFHAPFITHMMLVDATFLIIRCFQYFYGFHPTLYGFFLHYTYSFSFLLFVFSHILPISRLKLLLNCISTSPFFSSLVLPSFSSFRPFLFSSQISFVRRAAKLLTRIKEIGEVEVRRRIERCKGYCWSSSGWESPDWFRRWRERSVTTTMNRLYPHVYR